MLFERLALPVLKKTPKGAPSTDASVLQKMVDEHPVVEHLLAYRELEKLRSTYVDGLLPLIDSRRADPLRLQPDRGGHRPDLVSERPNMQNIPVRSEEGRTIRRAFVAASGQHVRGGRLQPDRVAHPGPPVSGDAGLLEAFAAGEDIHAATAARVFGVPRPDR